MSKNDIRQAIIIDDNPFNSMVALETLAATLKNENEIKGSMISKIMYDYLSRTTTATSVSTVERRDGKT